MAGYDLKKLICGGGDYVNISNQECGILLDWNVVLFQEYVRRVVSVLWVKVQAVQPWIRCITSPVLRARNAALSSRENLSMH